jgi:hypothetical protein
MTAELESAWRSNRWAVAMFRRRSEQTARMNARDFSHIVELPLPRSGFSVTRGAATSCLDPT